MNITFLKTNKSVRKKYNAEKSKKKSNVRKIDGFFLTIKDGILTCVENSKHSATVLTIPDDVRIIGKSAFSYVRVDEVILPETVEQIEDTAFKMSTIKRIDLTNIKSLGYAVFWRSSLEKVTYSKYLTYIPEKCFIMTNLSKFDVPEQVRILEPYCFFNTNLEKIDLSKITFLGTSVFTMCYHLKEIILSSTITEIPDQFCFNCHSLEYIDLSRIKVVGNAAFANCEKLNVGNLSIKIGNYAFAGTNVKHLTIEDVSKISAGAYSNCKHLESVKISGKDAIPDYLFAGCKNLNNITISEGITTIGERAFSGILGSASIKKIVLPSTVSTIKSSAFAECSELNEIALNNGLNTIEDNAFAGTKSLSEINIPDTVEHIGSECFTRSGLKKIKLPVNEKFRKISEDLFCDCENIQKIEFPDNIDKIDNCAFYGCESLRHANLENLSEIGVMAFSKTAFENITLTAKKIAVGAFEKCKNLKEADLSGITDYQLSSGLFSECKNLAKISLPKNQIKQFNKDCFRSTEIKEIIFK